MESDSESGTSSAIATPTSDMDLVDMETCGNNKNSFPEMNRSPSAVNKGVPFSDMAVEHRLRSEARTGGAIFEPQHGSQAWLTEDRDYLPSVLAHTATLNYPNAVFKSIKNPLYRPEHGPRPSTVEVPFVTASAAFPKFFQPHSLLNTASTGTGLTYTNLAPVPNASHDSIESQLLKAKGDPLMQLKAENAKLSAEVKECMAAIEELKTGSATFSVAIEQLKATNTAQAGIIEQLKTKNAELCQLENRFDTLSELQKLQRMTTSAQQGHLEALGSFVRPKLNTTDAAIATFTSRIGAVESGIALQETKTEDRFSGLEAEVQNLDNTFENTTRSLEDAFSNLKSTVKAQETTTSTKFAEVEEKLNGSLDEIEMRHKELRTTFATTDVTGQQGKEIKVLKTEVVPKIKTTLSDLTNLTRSVDQDLSHEIKELKSGLERIDKLEKEVEAVRSDLCDTDNTIDDLRRAQSQKDRDVTFAIDGSARGVIAKLNAEIDRIHDLAIRDRAILHDLEERVEDMENEI